MRTACARTIIELTGPEQRQTDPAARPAGLTTVRIMLDEPTDTEFWQRLGYAHSCTPLYYPAFLDRFPNAVCAVLTAITKTEAGGVLVHCASGRDRTGLIVLALLGLWASVARTSPMTTCSATTPVPDFADRLRAGGLDDARLAALRARVLRADRSAARSLRTVRWPGCDGP